MTVVVIGDNTGDDYSGLEDTWIDSVYQNTNGGSHASCYFGVSGGREMRTLQRFDLSGLTSTWTVSAASINLYDHDWVNRTADCTLNVYEIAAANGDWVEGLTGSDRVGEPTWVYKEFATVAWAGSAGLSTATTDYISTTLGTKIFTDGVSGYRAIDFDASGVATVEDWLGDATNNGFLLVGTGTGSYWTEFTSTDGTDGQRPYLSVTYTTGGGGTTSPWYYYAQH